MLLYIVFVVIALFFCMIWISEILRIHSKGWKENSIGECIFGTVIIAAVAAFSGLMLGSISSTVGPEKESRTEWTRNLASVDMGSTVEGSFFLGSGAIRGRFYYFGMASWGDGWKRLKWPVSESVIYEIDDDSQPRVETSEYVTYNRWIAPAWSVPEGEHSYKIYVPEGTIIRDYKVN